jgi:hypothetical protein
MIGPQNGLFLKGRTEGGCNINRGLSETVQTRAMNRPMQERMKKTKLGVRNNKHYRVFTQSH